MLSEMGDLLVFSSYKQTHVWDSAALHCALEFLRSHLGHSPCKFHLSVIPLIKGIKLPGEKFIFAKKCSIQVIASGVCHRRRKGFLFFAINSG